MVYSLMCCVPFILIHCPPVYLPICLCKYLSHLSAFMLLLLYTCHCILIAKKAFSEAYPSKPPKVRFLSKMFHPNIYKDGSICLDIIQDKWSPVYTVSSILTSIQSLLCDPNIDSPANPEAAQLYCSDRKAYNRRVRKCAEESLQSAISM